MSFSVCCADSFVLSMLSLRCLQLCSAVLFSKIHMSVVLCHLCPHLVLVFVLKNPLMKEVNPSGRCADIFKDAKLHTCMKNIRMNYRTALLDPQRSEGLCQSAATDVWWCDVCAHIVEAHWYFVYLSHTLVTVTQSASKGLLQVT